MKDYDPDKRAASLAQHARPKRVYLCGAIRGLSDEEAKGWRDEAKKALVAAHFIVLDPMRRDFRGAKVAPYLIVQPDIFDLEQSDVLLVNASRVGWGTPMEVAIAAYQNPHRKQIFAFGAGEDPSPWLVYHCDKLFADLAAALAFIVTGS